LKLTKNKISTSNFWQLVNLCIEETCANNLKFLLLLILHDIVLLYKYKNFSDANRLHNCVLFKYYLKFVVYVNSI